MKTSDNIRAMLQSVQDELDAMKTREEILKERKATLLAWLKEEAPNPVQADLLADSGATPLNMFLTALLASGKRLHAGAIGSMAADQGLIAGDVSPGRAVHGALLSLQRQGRAKRNNDGTWGV